MWLQFDWGNNPRLDGRRTHLFCAWVAWRSWCPLTRPDGYGPRTLPGPRSARRLDAPPRAVHRYTTMRFGLPMLGADQVASPPLRTPPRLVGVGVFAEGHGGLGLDESLEDPLQ